jgi:two-component system OmpR family response regulator
VTGSPRILLVDDEPSIREPLAAFLRVEGFAPTLASDAAEARGLVGEGRFDLALVDVMMPGEDGLSLAKHLVAERNLPVILLTARTDDIDRIVGLELGADDYVGKPFNPRELTARIKAVLRRTRQSKEQETAPGTRLHFDGLVLSPEEMSLTGRAGEPVELTGGEFRLLLVLAERAGRVVGRDDLLELTQNRTAQVFDRSVDNQISRLRRKVERDPGKPSLIKTVRGGGYSLAAKVERQ